MRQKLHLFIFHVPLYSWVLLGLKTADFQQYLFPAELKSRDSGNVKGNVYPTRLSNQFLIFLNFPNFFTSSVTSYDLTEWASIVRDFTSSLYFGI